MAAALSTKFDMIDMNGLLQTDVTMAGQTYMKFENVPIDTLTKLYVRFVNHGLEGDYAEYYSYETWMKLVVLVTSDDTSVDKLLVGDKTHEGAHDMPELKEAEWAAGVRGDDKTIATALPVIRPDADSKPYYAIIENEASTLIVADEKGNQFKKDLADLTGIAVEYKDGRQEEKEDLFGWAELLAGDEVKRIIVKFLEDGDEVEYALSDIITDANVYLQAKDVGATVYIGGKDDNAKANQQHIKEAQALAAPYQAQAVVVNDLWKKYEIARDAYNNDPTPANEAARDAALDAYNAAKADLDSNRGGCLRQDPPGLLRGAEF